MAMGIVSDKDFDSEFSKIGPQDQSKKDESKPAPKPIAEIIDVNRGRGTGNIEVPNSLRNLIGATAIEDGRSEALELAKSFGISSSSVSAYANGATSTADYNNGPNVGEIGKVKLKIAKKARGRLMAALRNITPDKLENAKAIELATVARSMSAIVKDMEETDNPLGKGNTGPTFVFYSPQVRREDSFEVIHAKE